MKTLTQQFIRCYYTEFQMKVPIIFWYVLIFPRIYRDRERNETFTEMVETL